MNDIETPNNAAQTSVPVKYNNKWKAVWASSGKYDALTLKKHLGIIRSWGYDGVITNITKDPCIDNWFHQFDSIDPPFFNFLCDGIKKSCLSEHKRRHEERIYNREHRPTDEVYHDDYEYGDTSESYKETDKEKAVRAQTIIREKEERRLFLSQQKEKWWGLIN